MIFFINRFPLVPFQEYVFVNLRELWEVRPPPFVQGLRRVSRMHTVRRVRRSIGIKFRHIVRKARLGFRSLLDRLFQFSEMFFQSPLEFPFSPIVPTGPTGDPTGRPTPAEARLGATLFLPFHGWLGFLMRSSARLIQWKMQTCKPVIPQRWAWP